jgi:hypothetical protein
MAVSTNKTSKSKTVKMDTSTPSKASQATKPSFSVEPIENGWILSKSYTDKDGKWCNERKYVEENPLSAIFEDKK